MSKKSSFLPCVNVKQIMQQKIVLGYCRQKRKKPFYNVCFFGKSCQKTQFSDIADTKPCMCTFLANQERKDRFLIFRIEKNKFKTRKVKFQKMCEKFYFVHVFCEKNAVFYHAGFLGKLRQKRSLFFKFWIGKNTFQSRKVNFQKYL